MIRNPVLPGFHPDPSIVRVGDDYYLATSSFEWYPGVRVHHSRDLVHWRPLGGILTERRLLDLSGVPDSGGVWAPDLTYHDGLFHLVYGVMDNYALGYKDVANHLITAPSIEGPWSDPVRLPGRGFDASLYHEDGRTWLLSMVFDSRPGRGFAGIEMRSLDGGKPELILPDREVTEGPHLYRIGGWYYLMVAEGGTGYQHQVTVLRSRSMSGPFEEDPAGPMLTSRHDPGLELQKAGHGCLVETQTGEWYLAHLAARPYHNRACVLGRETAIQRVVWEDGWPRVAGGVPAVEVAPPALPACPWPADEDSGGIDGGLGARWSTLRRPASPDWVVAARDGLTIKGGQSPYGLRSPSLVARPVTARTCSLEAVVRFEPDGVHQSAGITAYYNSRNWHYLALTSDGLVLTTSDRGTRTEHLLGPAGPEARLRVELDGPVVRFNHGPELDATILSDEHADERVDGHIRSFGFTGAFVGLWVQDLAGEGGTARFEQIRYTA
ncbi:family 43 glycosylhydrolase [Nonomuraea phyllanthi]|uniref:glycoside hydrolase family 43 protein n=1 Tax=Nonomuraea phyllanthi TaxID=2219224 RepID=UPI001293A4CA|nr:glycoside hydrolase family 43 protein [Nonomuraea phyllanthi]QFY11097.1 family 43 glycosylhydrolase [Nonomuraea phyllanthi]